MEVKNNKCVFAFQGRMFKYFIIGLHATVCAIVAVILVIIIAVNWSRDKKNRMCLVLPSLSALIRLYPLINTIATAKNAW